MNRARFRLFALLVLSGIVTAIISSLLLGITFALITEGPTATLYGLRLGANVIWFGLAVATVPAILFGGMLWFRGVRRALAWAVMGLVGGIVCLAVAYVGPGDIGPTTHFALKHYPAAFPAAFAITSALAALIFLALMRLLTKVVRGRPSFRRA